MTPRLRPRLQRGDNPGEPVLSTPEADHPAARPGLAGCDNLQCDEAASDAARRWYRAHLIEPLVPDCRIKPMLAAGESVFVVRRALLMDLSGAPRSGCPAGDLYLTSRRLLHVGAQLVVVDLDAVGEVVLVPDGVAVTMVDGDSLRLEVDEPRLLRVQIAAARTARRRGRMPRVASRPVDR